MARVESVKSFYQKLDHIKHFMKLGVMQPYLFPYIGYFQLIKSVDLFVIHDNVQYIKGGWINRNRILVNGEPRYFILPIHAGVSSNLINERRFTPKFQKDKDAVLRQIQGAYHKAPHFAETFELVEECFQTSNNNLSAFITQTVQLCCRHLEISTPFRLASALSIYANLRGQEKVIAINKHFGSDHYVNPVGGMELYDRHEFLQHAIRLSFIKTEDIQYPQLGGKFVPNLSIIDVLMNNNRDVVLNFLSRFALS